MRATEVICAYCQKVFSILDEIANIEEKTHPAKNYFDITSEEVTMMTKECPHCGKENNIYWANMPELFCRKTKQEDKND